MATIKRRRKGDGSYYKKWTIEYTDRDGRRRRAVGFTDAAASLALAKSIEKKEQLAKDGIIQKDPEPIERLIDMYAADLIRQGNTAMHCKTQFAFLTRMAKECSWKTPADITVSSLSKFLAKISQTAAPRTQNHYRHAAIAFAGWLVANSWIEDNPITNVPKSKITASPRKRRTITMLEFAALVNSAPQNRSQIYTVAALSGLRAREIQLLEKRDCFLMPGKLELRLRPEATKAKRAERIPMIPELAEVLSKVVIKAKDPTEKLFPKRINHRTFKSDLARAKIEQRTAEGQLDFHSLRYFFAWLIARHLPIQTVRILMRHRDIRTTLNLYLQLGLDDVREDMLKLDTVLSSPPKASTDATAPTPKTDYTNLEIQN